MNRETYPTTTAGWLHLLDMEKAAAWSQGYAQGIHRANKNNLTTERKEDVCECLKPLKTT